MSRTRDGLASAVENCRVGDGSVVEPFSTLVDCTIGNDCTIWRYVNMYGCELGDDCMVGSFVEIQEDATIGDRCRIQSHAFVCSKVHIGDDVFVSHGATFVNDRRPPSGDESEWESTHVGDGVVVGSNATLLPVEIGANALIGAGAVVTDDVPAGAVVAGNPAEVIEYRG